MTKLAVKYLPIKQLKAYEGNAKNHSPTQVQELADLIREFGFTNPVLIDEGNTIIAGHGRVMAAELLGMDKVPTIVLPNLSERQKRAFRLADNKISEKSSWDIEKLSAELSALQVEGFDLSLTAFDESELDSLLREVEEEQDDTGSDYEDEESILPARNGARDLDAKPYEPNLTPQKDEAYVTDKEIEQTRERLENQFNAAKPQLEVCCPKCAHIFHIDK